MDVRIISAALAALLLASIALFSMIAPACADNGGYVVMPYHPDANLTPEQLALIDNSGADATVSFWELPLWIQVSYSWGALLTVAGSLLVLPLAVRRLKSPLDNRNRQSVYNYIEDNPGCIAPDVSRNTGMNKGTVRYHIQRLELESKIVLRKIGKFMRLYRNSSTYDEREKLVASHLRNKMSKAVIEVLMEHPGSTNQEVSELIKVEKSLIYRYIQQLINDRIVSAEDDGKHKRYFIAEVAKPAVIKLLPRNYQCPGMMREYGKGEA
jgi:predicted transcriptional regulator